MCKPDGKIEGINTYWDVEECGIAYSPNDPVHIDIIENRFIPVLIKASEWRDVPLGDIETCIEMYTHSNETDHRLLNDFRFSNDNWTPEFMTEEEFSNEIHQDKIPFPEIPLAFINGPTSPFRIHHTYDGKDPGMFLSGIGFRLSTEDPYYAHYVSKIIEPFLIDLGTKRYRKRAKEMYEE